MKGNQRRVRMGGLLRCCIATVAEMESETQPGDRAACTYCKESTLRVADDGVWEWDHDLDDVLGKAADTL